MFWFENECTFIYQLDSHSHISVNLTNISEFIIIISRNNRPIIYPNDRLMLLYCCRSCGVFITDYVILFVERIE